MLQIPGRWEVFIDQLRVSALEDCLTFYESNMALLNKKHSNGKHMKSKEVESKLKRGYYIYCLPSLSGPINETELLVSNAVSPQQNANA